MGTDGAGATAEEVPESPRYVYDDGRWVAEHWRNGTWVREDTAAADQREAALTRGYENSAATAAAAPPMAAAPPPMATPPPAGGAQAHSAGRFLGPNGAA